MPKSDEQRNRQLAKEQRERARAKKESAGYGDLNKKNFKRPAQSERKQAKPPELSRLDRLAGDFRLVMEICAAVGVVCAVAITVILSYHVQSLLTPALFLIFIGAVCFPFFWRFRGTPVRLALALTFALALAGCSYWEYHLIYPSPTETEISGVLIPANVPRPPTPPNCTPPPPEAMTVFFGGGMATTTTESNTVINVANDDLLSLKRGDKGLLLSAKIFSRDSRVVAQIVDNEFHINPNNYFRRDRPNKSTLIVYDQQSRAVLNVRYLNPLAVKVSGLFFYPQHPPLVISDNSIRFGTNILTAPCSEGSATMFKID